MARAVRISRWDAGRPGAAPGAAPAEGYRPNTAALTRSTRLFLLFLVGLLLAYGTFVGLLYSRPAAAASVGTGTLGLLSLFAAVVAVYGFAITLGRTPRAVETSGDRLVVIEFLGTRRSFPLDGSFRPTVENRYATGPLAPQPTEMVALASARGPTRRYLLAAGLVAPAAP